jgi:hypothetical protein
MPDARRQLLLAIIHGEEANQVEIAQAVRYRQLDELAALGLIQDDGGWKLTQRAAMLLDAAGLA